MEITSEYARVRDAGDWLRRQLQSRLSGAQLDDIELAVAEGLTNIVRHAYGERPGQPIEIRLEVEPPNVVVTLRDRGKPIAAADSAGRTHHDYAGTDTADLPESGMGISIIRQLATIVAYQRIDGTNQLALTFSGSE